MAKSIQVHGFSEETIDNVFKKARIVAEYASLHYRQDDCSAWIQRQHYGNISSPYGWVIDRIDENAEPTEDDISNLRPLHWKNALSKKHGKVLCPVKSSGDKNVGI